MASILGVGIAVLDVITQVDTFPIENQKSRALSRQCRRGGNTTNSLVVLSQLGHRCTWVGNHVTGSEAQLINSDLDKYGIDYSLCRIINNAQVPTSTIILNKSNASRTVIHFRDLKEYTFTDFQSIDLFPFDWIHFEGRNAQDTLLMLQKVKSSTPLKCSIELEKSNPGIEKCINYADVVLVSRDYVTGRGFRSAETFLELITGQYTQPVFTCTWGDTGAYAKVGARDIVYSPAVKLKNSVDTIGAGDVFNAGFIHAQIENKDVSTSLHFACQIAGNKCAQLGFDNIV